MDGLLDAGEVFLRLLRRELLDRKPGVDHHIVPHLKIGQEIHPHFLGQARGLPHRPAPFDRDDAQRNGKTHKQNLLFKSGTRNVA